MKQNKLRDMLVASLTMFAMFLGAGNIIFPPLVGVQAGAQWVLAALGFIITAAGLPLIGTITVARLDGNSDRLTERAWPLFGKILNVTIIIMIGPLFAIPRTAATTYEMSALPFLPETLTASTFLGLPLPFVIGSALFFLLTYILSVSKSTVMDAIGGVLAPLLVIFLFITIILAIVRPMGAPAQPLLTESIFYYGFSSGYQTMDGIGSLVMSGAVASLMFNKGYGKKETGKMMIPIGLIAGLLLGSVYVGYIWIGASASAIPGVTQYLGQRTALLGQSLYQLFQGNAGRILLGLIIFFACLTTSTGLVVTFSNYFQNLSKGRLSYRALVIFCTLISFAISLIGVEGIISLAAPVLEVIYPICIVLIILNICSRHIPYDEGFRGALIGVMIAAAALFILNRLGMNESSRPLRDSILSCIPLGKEGFGYLLPAALGYVFGFLQGEQNAKKQPARA